MSDPVQLGQSDFVLELLRLNEAQITATTPEDREHADHELAIFLRMNGAGRLQEYFASRQARNDA